MKIHTKIEDIKFKDGISELIVMESQAGCYIGRVDCSEGYMQPYSRESHYMTQSDAELYLKRQKDFGISTCSNFDG